MFQNFNVMIAEKETFVKLIPLTPFRRQSLWKGVRGIEGSSTEPGNRALDGRGGAASSLQSPYFR